MQGLEDDTKRHLLQKVIDGEMTLKDITCQSKEIKSIKRLQSAFMAFANAEDWSEMKERFPLHTSEEKLFQFKDVKLVKNAPIPKVSKLSASLGYVISQAKVKKAYFCVKFVCLYDQCLDW